MALWKCESMVTVPAATYGCHVDAGAASYLSAQNTYLSSTATGGTNSLVAAFQALLAAVVASTTVVLDDDTGKIKITWGSGTHTLTWDSTALRDLLGFAGTLTPAAASFTATKQATPLWLPNVSPGGLYASIGSIGRRSDDAVVTRARSGAVYTTVHNTYREQQLIWRGLSKAKTWTEDEAVTNESAESWWNSHLRTGSPFRAYTDRATDTTYQTTSTASREYVYAGGGFQPVRMSNQFDSYWVWTMDLHQYV